MKQMSVRWYEWSRYSPGRQLDEHGHFLAGEGGQPGLIVDPVAFNEGDREHLAELGGAAAVVLTGPGRVEEGERCAKTRTCPVVTAYTDPTASFPGGLIAIPVPVRDIPDSAAGRPQPVPEVALYHPETATALVGASVVGSPAGLVSLAFVDGAEHAKHADPALLPGTPPAVAARTPGAAAAAESVAARTARGLRGLLAGRLQTLLVGAGTSLVHQPARALQDLVYRHDPAAMRLRTDELRWNPPTGLWTLGTRFAQRYAECARLLGLRTLDFEVTEVPPGRQGGQLHRHDGQEELFVVLSGSGEPLTEQGSYLIHAGDLLGFPPRYQIAHAFRNTGDVPLRYLAFGAPTETLDMVDYPETNVRAEVTPFGKRHRFHLPEARGIPYWDGVRTE